MGFLAGLVFGLVVAAATVILEHYGPSSDQLGLSLSGNGAIAVPEVLVPVGIFWGWSWIANAYSGRSLLPIAAYTLGLLLGVSAIGPADAYFFPQSDAGLTVNAFLGGLFQGCLFVGLAALIAAPIYWLLRSRVGENRILIWIGYLASLAIAFVPFFGTLVAGGIVAGVASGHAWQRQGGRTVIAIIAIVIMVLAVFGIPYLLGTVLPAPR
jgi:MFS family permease